MLYTTDVHNIFIIYWYFISEGETEEMRYRAAFPEVKQRVDTSRCIFMLESVWSCLLVEKARKRNDHYIYTMTQKQRNTGLFLNFVNMLIVESHVRTTNTVFGKPNFKNWEWQFLEIWNVIVWRKS
jgi:hypothetical protein